MMPSFMTVGLCSLIRSKIQAQVSVPTLHPLLWPMQPPNAVSIPLSWQGVKSMSHQPDQILTDITCPLLCNLIRNKAVPHHFRPHCPLTPGCGLSLTFLAYGLRTPILGQMQPHQHVPPEAMAASLCLPLLEGCPPWTVDSFLTCPLLCAPCLCFAHLGFYMTPALTFRSTSLALQEAQPPMWPVLSSPVLYMVPTAMPYILVA